MGKDEHRRRLENTMRNRDIVGEPTFILEPDSFDIFYLVVCPTFQVAFLGAKVANLTRTRSTYKFLVVLVIGIARDVPLTAHGHPPVVHGVVVPWGVP